MKRPETAPPAAALTRDTHPQGAVLHEAATPAIDRLAAFKAAVSGLLDDYFASGDCASTTAALEELGHPLYSHYFVKRAVRGGSAALAPLGSAARVVR